MQHVLYFWVILGACALFFGMANPFVHVPLFILFYPASLYMIACISKSAFRWGILCSLLGSSASLYFISITLHTYGNFPWLLAIPCTVTMGIYLGFWGGLFSFAMRKVLCVDPFLRAIFAGCFWYLCEWSRAYLFTGFPWHSLSSAFVPFPAFIQGASIVGAFGLSGVFVTISVLIIMGFLNEHRKPKFLQGKNLLSHMYKISISFAGTLFLCLLFFYGETRLKSSVQDNSYPKNPNGSIFYSHDLKKPYTSFIFEKEPLSRNSKDDYFEYHNNPARIGKAYHQFVLPNFLKDKNSDTYQNIYMPEDLPLFFSKNIAQNPENSENILAKIPSEFFKQKNLLFFTTVQGNVSQSIKWEPAFQFATVQKYLRLSSEAETLSKKIFPFIDFYSEEKTKKIQIPAIFVWPETAIPVDFSIKNPFSEMIEAFASPSKFLSKETEEKPDYLKDRKILFGAAGIERDESEINYFNRLFFWQGEKESFYNKEHLVPFGEYIPELPFFPDIFKKLIMGFGVFTAGKNQELYSIQTQEKEDFSKISALICYEAIFPDMAQEDVALGSELFINVSNDAWYDKTSANQQHLHLSIMRAVEQKRFMVRAGNTGISAIIDDYGRIMAQTQLFIDVSLSGFVLLKSEKTSFFYIKKYLTPIACFIIFVIFLAAQRERHSVRSCSGC